MTNYRKVPKNIDKLAELAAEHYCHDTMDCVKTVKAVRAQWQRQDMFSCDVLGKRADGSLVALQVTVSDFRQAVDSRKRKIEQEFWHTSDTVQILQLIREGKEWYFKVYWFSGNKDTKWVIQKNLVHVPGPWFKKWKLKAH